MSADRLALIKARHAEAGAGDADKTWLIEEVERLREVPGQIASSGGACSDSNCRICHDHGRRS